MKITKNVKKTSRIGNPNFGGEFQDYKIVKPVKVRDKQIQNFFLINFDIWNIEIGVYMRKLWLFYEQTPN